MPTDSRSARPTTWSEPLGRYGLIAVGGAAGTLARYGLARLWPVATNGFPWATLVANVGGGFVLGLILTLVVERWRPTTAVRPLVAIGFCGGLTTWSTLMLEIAQRGRHGDPGLAVAYLAITLVVGFGAVVAGIAVGRIGAEGKPSLPVPDPDSLGDLGDAGDRGHQTNGHDPSDGRPS
jgi:CrcB protein